MTITEKLKRVKQRLAGIESSSDADTDIEKGATDNESSTMTTNTRTQASDDDSELELLPDERRNFGKQKFRNTDKPDTWNILIRIIEAKDVCAGSLRVRTIFDGKSKMTRSVSHAVPRWRQNLLYTIANQPLEKLAAKILTLRLVRPTTLGETSIGEFSVYLSEVIHLEDRSVISKWVALGVCGDDAGGYDDAFENCGFLKVSISVYQKDELPPTLIDDDGREQIWSGAHLYDYTLSIHLYSVMEMLRKMINEKAVRRKKQTFYLMVDCGAEKVQTSLEEAFVDEETGLVNVSFQQVISLPIKWPTVISEIIFSLYTKKGRSRTCIGKATIPMRKIYEPGENGYLPSFGPAYLNLFDYERVTGFSALLKRAKAGAQQDGSRFIGRLFLSIDCLEMVCESTEVQPLNHSAIKVAEKLMSKTQSYFGYCSMSALNMINPQFASDPISILVSIGSNGSMGTDAKYCNSSTLPALPDTDKCKYFVMPWGNLRPIAEVTCVFEDVEERIEMSNVLMKLANLLDRMIYEVRRIGNGALDRQASVGIEALENLEEMIESASTFLKRFQLSSDSNYLDRKTLECRIRKIAQLRENFAYEALHVDYSDEEVENKLLRMLQQIRSLAVELADDVQLTLPPILIKMMSYGKLIGFAKIAISEIFQSTDKVQSGEWCGRTRQINIQWPRLVDQKNQKDEYVAVLHAKMWFGSQQHLSKWRDHLQPADIKHFMEVYELQSKGLSLKWKDGDARGLLTNGEGKQIDGTLPEVPSGWKPAGYWTLINTRDMFVTDIGSKFLIDKIYEVHKREDDKFIHYKFTDYFGCELKVEDLNEVAKGCAVENWKPDQFRNNGDENGWVYANEEVFHEFGHDREEKHHHQYRRRCIKRRRTLPNKNKDLENFDTYRATLDEKTWEYTKNKGGPYHVEADSGDSHRRRRFLREVAHEDPATVSPSLRLYEFQIEAATWQLRCYIMWANDLLPVVKNSSRALVRISFGTETKQTLLVGNSQNPIWNETVIFKGIVMAGATRDIVRYPPIITVEVVGELLNDEEVNLGRFEANPTVICSMTDKRGAPRWFPLCFSKQRTRGSVLACFELFGMADEDLLPLEPAKKHNAIDRMEIPLDYRPQFDKYHIQFLCWGVRNLKKHKLLSVRRPFVELIIGDQEFTLEPLKDVRKNPNFPEPMIVFGEVLLPSALELSPPFVINLFDARSFNRTPLVGTCIISDLRKYVSCINPKSRRNSLEKLDALDAVIDEERQKIIAMNRKQILTKDPMVPLDWWSRYYSSMSQFHRSPGYPESGMEYLRVFRGPLEEMNSYNYFTDFLETLPFVKAIKGDFDNPDEKEVAGELKCRLLISKIRDNKVPPTLNTVVDYFGPTKCIVRVYVVEANGLVSNARKGRIDSYIKLKCGGQKINLKKNYRSECCDPIYGERIDLNVTIPLEKDLQITVMDKRRILTDQEIGSTTIDLENRLLSKWRATCGMSTQYTVHGEQQWRDQKTPLEILQAYCYKMMLSAPIIERRKHETGEEKGITIEKVTFWFSDILQATEKEEVALLDGQRQKAGKETGSTDNSEEDNNVDDSWDDYDPELEKERAKWEKQRSKTAKPKKKKKVEKPSEAAETSEETADGQVRRRAKTEIMGTQLEAIALFILRTMNLVPEHVETRPLYSDKTGTIKKGELRMFVDIFPMELGPIPAPLNIAPRKPINYQLRIAVMDVRGAIPVKRSFADPVSDLYVKVFVNGMTKGHKTDTHFRVLDGSGEFNWRFLLNFDYNPWEKKVVAYTKTRFFRKPVAELVDPILIIELWDKNKFRTDRMLGDIELDLLDFIEGIGSPADVGIFSSRKRNHRCKVPKCCTSRGCLCKCCTFCYQTKCLCGRRKVVKKPFPKPKVFVEPEGYEDTVNLFEARNVYGWWPMLNYLYPHEEPQDAKKKDDDVEKHPRWIMGLVEMDMTLLTLQEAEQEPVGHKRSEPNHSPYLEKPDRKSWANSWLVSRIKPCAKYIWHYYGQQIILWLIIILIIVLMVMTLIETWPVVFVEILKALF